MKVAIYGRPIRLNDFAKHFSDLISVLDSHNIAFDVVDQYQDFLSAEYGFKHGKCSSNMLNINNYSCLISIGGDGTMLDTLQLVRDTSIPVMGINLGRLGFLADITTGEVEDAIKALINDDFDIDTRSVLEIHSDHKELMEFPYALNDFVVQKRDTSAMITVNAQLNNDLLNNYWADGLIVATPTGSSGYSLSCGGPLLFPGSKGFAITPIAAHNLTVRPIVVSDDSVLELKVSSRANSILVTLDSRSYKVPNHTQIQIKRAPFNFNMIKLKANTYMDTIRNKLLWGADKRNEDQ